MLSDGDGNPQIYNNGTATFFRYAGGGANAKISGKYTATVTTSATTISALNNDYGVIVIVNGFDGGNIFTDLIFTCTTAGPTVLSAKSISGGPASRTYTMSSGNLQLAMASGTYGIYCNQYTGI